MNISEKKYTYTLIGLRRGIFAIQTPRVIKNNFRLIVLSILTSVFLLATFSLDLLNPVPAICPNAFEEPNAADILTKSIGTYKCKPIKSKGDEFDIWLCLSSSLCYEGHFLINRRDKDACRRADAMHISDNSTTEFYAKRHIGPDAFHAFFYGAEKLAVSDQEHLGDCTYKLPFRFSNAGEVSYDIIHIYRDYNHFNELFDGWPPILLNSLTPTDNTVSICGRCPSRVADPTGPEEPKTTDALPLCSIEVPVKGAWLPADQRDRDGYKHSKYSWTPLGCQMPNTFEVGSGDACLTQHSRNILFVGDSHVRVTFDGLGRRLRGDITPFYDIIKWVNFSEKIHNVTLQYQAFDPYLNDLLQKSCEDMLIYDTIYFDVGHWPASGLRLGGHWTTQRFVDHLIRVRDHLAITLRSCRKEDDLLRLVWQGHHFFPLRDDDNVRTEMDWRTPPRLKYWGDLANIVFEKAPIARMNSYEITVSMGDTSADGCHYNGADALDGIINEALHKLDLCSPRVKSNP